MSLVHSNNTDSISTLPILVLIWYRSNLSVQVIDLLCHFLFLNCGSWGILHLQCINFSSSVLALPSIWWYLKPFVSLPSDYPSLLLVFQPLSVQRRLTEPCHEGDSFSQEFCWLCCYPTLFNLPMNMIFSIFQFRYGTTILLVPGSLILNKFQLVVFTPILQPRFGVTCKKYFSKRMALGSFNSRNI